MALVEIVAELFNGEEDTGEGSGFLIGDSIVLTDSHVIPRKDDYRKVTMTVRLASRSAPPIATSLLERDSESDLAVLKLETPQPLPRPPCPIESYALDASVPKGTELVVLGYPVGQDLSVSGGVLSNRGTNRRWQTDATMNVGNSGGPVFDLQGYLLGFAVSGMTWYGDGDTGNFVTGVNFFVPVGLVMASAVSARLSQPPICWRVADAATRTVSAEATPAAPTATASNATGSNATVMATAPSSDAKQASAETFGSDIQMQAAKAAEAAERADAKWRMSARMAPDLKRAAAEAAAVAAANVGASTSVLPPDAQNAADTPTGLEVPPSPPLLANLSRQVPLSFRQDNRGWFAKSVRGYVKRIEADVGYRIDACEPAADIALNANSSRCTIAPDGRSAEFATVLTKPRAWWSGQVTVKQRLEGP